jgi:hypothetical protein
MGVKTKIMRKLFIMSALMLVGSFAFADSSNTERKADSSNTEVKVVEYFGTCTVTITESNGDGTANVYTYIFETSTERDCANAALAIGSAFLDGRK